MNRKYIFAHQLYRVHTNNFKIFNKYIQLKKEKCIHFISQSHAYSSKKIKLCIYIILSMHTYLKWKAVLDAYLISKLKQFKYDQLYYFAILPLVIVYCCLLFFVIFVSAKQRSGAHAI